jgi:uncharacterized membrane protein YeaQ/YmgE (transglycosylase-associated protein family)
MPLLFPMLGLVSLAGLAGWVAGLLLHRRSQIVLTDVLQGICGAALCLEVYMATGATHYSPGELISVALVGAWVSVGVAHVAARALRRYGAR